MRYVAADGGGVDDGGSELSQPDEERDAIELLAHLGVGPRDGRALLIDRTWRVYIYPRRKKPLLEKWRGFPVRYVISGPKE